MYLKNSEKSFHETLYKYTSSDNMQLTSTPPTLLPEFFLFIILSIETGPLHSFNYHKTWFIYKALFVRESEPYLYSNFC